MELNCRICLEEADIVIYLYEEVKDVDYSLDLQCNLSKLLYQCGGLKIERDDPFSKYICYTCTKDLLYVAQFRQKCRLAEETLNNIAQMEEEDVEIVECNETEIKTASNDKNDTEEVCANIEVDNSNQIIEEYVLEVYEESNDIVSLQSEKVAEEIVVDTTLQIVEKDNFANLLSLHDGEMRPYTPLIGEDSRDNNEVTQEEFTINDLIEYDENAELDTAENADDINFESSMITNQFVCDACGAKFRLASNLRRHLTMAHSVTQYFSCEKCNYCFSTIAKYKEHCSSCKCLRIKRKCGDYQCIHCGKTLCSASALAIHLRMHTGERPFQCTNCPKAFKTNAALSIHLKRHFGKAEYSCEICNKLFYETSNLKIHMRTHTGEKPHKCNTCDKSFSRVFSLEAHIRVHSGERPFGCLYCEKRFKQLPDLKNHELTHAGEKKHKCNVCNKSFIKKRQLIMHMSRHKANSLENNAVESTLGNEADCVRKDLSLQEETENALQSICNEYEDFIEEIPAYCRLCATLRKKDLFSQLTEELCDKVNQSIKIKIILVDNLSKSICEDCINDVQQVFKFYTKVNEAQELLGNLFLPTYATEDNGEARESPKSKQTLGATLIQSLRENSGQNCDQKETKKTEEKNLQQQVATRSSKRLKRIHSKNVPALEKEISERTDGSTTDVVAALKAERVSMKIKKESKFVEQKTILNADLHTKTHAGTVKDSEEIDLYEVNICDEDNLVYKSQQRESDDDLKSVDSDIILIGNVLNQVRGENMELSVERGENQRDLEEYATEYEVLIESDDSELKKEEKDNFLLTEENVTNSEDVNAFLLQENDEQEEELEIEESFTNSVKESISLTSWNLYTWCCSDCTYTAKSFIELVNHSQSVHKKRKHDMEYKCFDCQKICQRYNSFLNHVRIRHHPALMKHCDVCYEEFTDFKELSEHREYKCSMDSNLFPSVAFCNQCGKGYFTASALLNHIRYQHSKLQKYFECEDCGKHFKRVGALKAHHLIHTDTKDYTCDQCGRAFRQKINLDVHLISHESQKGFVCQTCHKKFKTSLNLEKHMLIHSNVKEFKCDYCNKEFRTKDVKMAHERIHTGEKPYKCTYCDRAFRFRGTFLTHINIHNGLRPYVCSECDSAFTNWSNLNKHIKRRHDNTATNGSYTKIDSIRRKYKTRKPTVKKKSETNASEVTSTEVFNEFEFIEDEVYETIEIVEEGME
ncbi:zinc finger protein 107-like [Teleopsis dalmanni]|uniref:zinc finger protein 107-like n=1 Tax=Teleopsis dalmanni TaxID=139649 RepID=UPI0018CD6E3B|nr:zinc finger protein 107-like [Teleopsis dalmanni]